MSEPAVEDERAARIAYETDGLLGRPQQGGLSGFWRVNRRGVYLAAAGRVCALLPDGAPLSAAGLPPMTVMGALWETVEYAFLQGRDVTDALKAMLGPDVRIVLRVAGSEYLEFCALCVWYGRKDLLERLPSLPPGTDPAYSAFRDACAGLFFENLKAADTACVLLKGLSLSSEAELRLTAACLLAAVVHAKGALDRDRLVRLARHLSLAGSGGEGPRFVRDNPEAEAALAFRRKILDPVCQALALADADLDERLRAFAVAHAAPKTPRWMFEKPMPLWKRALGELQTAVESVRPERKNATPKEGVITWTVTFDGTRRDRLRCTSVAPCFRRPRGLQDGSDDAPQTLAAVSSGRFAPCCREIDREILRVLLDEDYQIKRQDSVPLAALEILCRHPHVVTEVGRAQKEVSFTRGEWSFEVAHDGADGMRVSVPVGGRGFDGAYAVVERDPSTFELFVADGLRREVLGIFARYSDEQGVLAVPKEGLESARWVLKGLAEKMPLTGELGLVAGTDDFTRVPGDVMPTARLVWDGETLLVSLCLRPLGEQNLLTVRPGEGVRERLVTRGGKTVVLVRDLEAECAAAAVVRKTVREFTAEGPDLYHWEIGDLQSALAALSALHGLGERVRLEWLGRRLNVSRPANFRIRGRQGRYLEVSGEVDLDDGKVADVIQLLRSMKGRMSRFVSLGENDYLELSAELTARLELLNRAGTVRNDAVAFAPAVLPLLDEKLGDGGGDGLALPAVLRREAADVRRRLASTPAVPTALHGELRAYQKEGFLWLMRLADCGFGACLADDMGLGKTVQIIALLLARAAEGSSLVLAPASVCANWHAELARFAPSLRVIPGWGAEEDPAVWDGDVVVASYGLLVSRAAAFTDCGWNVVVLDESQAIKNDETKRAQTARELRAKVRVAATGTPVENNLGELWSLFEFLNPGLLGPCSEFTPRFVDEEGRAREALKELVHPFILRRMKREVLDDLPEKTEITLPVELGEAERSAYEGCRRFALENLRGKESDRMSVLAALTGLRRFCCHPSLALPEMTDSAKMDVLLGLLANLRSNGHRALVFSQFTDYLSLVRAEVEGRGWTCRYLDGATPPPERARSVAAFQNGEGDFFLISLKAGGTGLNLTAANYVILLDPWWNPAVETQAADRAHRIGQKNPVTVYRLIVSNTVEEKMLKLHRAKEEMTRDLLDGALQRSLSVRDLLALVEN